MNGKNTEISVERAMRMENVDRTELKAIEGGFLVFVAGLIGGYYGTKAYLDSQPKLGSALKNIAPR